MDNWGLPEPVKTAGNFAKYVATNFVPNVGREFMANTGDHLKLAGSAFNSEGLINLGKEVDDYWRQGQTEEWKNIGKAGALASDFMFDPVNALGIGVGAKVLKARKFIPAMDAWGRTEDATSAGEILTNNQGEQ
jgi:hypothetical protein